MFSSKEEVRSSILDASKEEFVVIHTQEQAEFFVKIPTLNEFLMLGIKHGSEVDASYQIEMARKSIFFSINGGEKIQLIEPGDQEAIGNSPIGTLGTALVNKALAKISERTQKMLTMSTSQEEERGQEPGKK